MKKILLILAAAAVLAATVGLPMAYAHTGRDALRTHRQCKAISKRWHHMRQHCYECVARPRHHFHPGYPEGDRCQRNGHK